MTPPEEIDAFLGLSMRRDVIIATYGDMIRVPGSTPGDNLARRRALGAQVQVVYSPVDAIETARQNPGKEVVFLGVGFETTAPGTAAAALTATEDGIKNFTVFSMLIGNGEQMVFNHHVQVVFSKSCDALGQVGANVHVFPRIREFVCGSSSVVGFFFGIFLPFFFQIPERLVASDKVPLDQAFLVRGNVDCPR